MADGVDSWKAGDLEPIERELSSPPPDTVLVLIARGKASARLAKAVEKAGGELREYEPPKPWQLPKWTAERAREEGLQLDGDAAKRLVEGAWIAAVAREAHTGRRAQGRPRSARARHLRDRRPRGRPTRRRADRRAHRGNRRARPRGGLSPRQPPVRIRAARDFLRAP